MLVSNHISYLDFIFDGLAALPQKRLVRFMAKESVFRHKISGPLMRGMKHIPVDRKQGETPTSTRWSRCAPGEIIGVFPEATISQSFTLKSFKSGAARLAQEAGVPLIPMALWGTQRLWTKGHPRNFKRSHIPDHHPGRRADGGPAATSTRAPSPGGCASGSRSCWRPRSAPIPVRPEGPGRHLVAARPSRRHARRPPKRCARPRPAERPPVRPRARLSRGVDRRCAPRG